MINETFVAKTPKEAYEEAVLKYGNQIKLLSAKQVKYDDGILRCEVSVAVPKEIFMEKSVVDESEASLEEQALFEELNLLKKELARMKKDMLESEEESVVHSVKSLFIEKGISQKWLDDVLATLMGNSMLKDKKLLLSYILEEIDETLEVYDELLEEPKIIMLVGPTGVGKTTTIAKLAARYAYMMDRPYKVAFLNLDSYKVGAFDQLGQYADIMQIDHITVDSLEAFMHGLERVKGYDVILIDTAGMSPYDTQKFIRTVEFVRSDMPLKIEVNLVLSATVKYEDMDDIYKNFSFLNLNSVIISKFDETKHLGTLLNFMLCYKVPMSYFSIGQEVPDDLLVASKEYLLERFIGDLEDS
ncbi:Flagellar biosynthesis protein FlhF [hydrothermal vent metagenome]|uniref:Flagellar biosynthesis protein FlhF n=1 Tax=hydrothermal vent metagenome TaxID=652676 RepID=A0A1W1CMQ6_9ZZZZ